MGEVEKAKGELFRVAKKCGMDPNDAVEDLAQSVEEANRRAGLPASFKDENDFARWWIVFFEQHTLKCIGRWQARCASPRDYEAMRSQWGDYEVVWQAGCEFQIALGSSNLLKHHQAFLDKLSAEGKPVSASDNEALLSWFQRREDAVRTGLASHKEKQREAVAQTLVKLKEYDQASMLGKIRRRVFHV